MRFLAGSIPDWTALFKEAYKCLKPGGYIESMEPSPIIESDDGTVDEKSAMAQWGKIFVEGGRRSGRSWTVVPDKTQQKALEEAGFENLQVSDFKVSSDISDILYGNPLLTLYYCQGPCLGMAQGSQTPGARQRGRNLPQPGPRGSDCLFGQRSWGLQQGGTASLCRSPEIRVQREAEARVVHHQGCRCTKA